MEKTWMPTTAGILCIIVGGLGFLGGLILGVIASAFVVTSTYSGPGNEFLSGAAVWLVFLPYVIVNAVAVAGGVYALRRRLWGLALAGAICATLSIWAWPVGVASIVFIALSRDEFNHHVYPRPPSPPPNSLPPASPP